MTLLSRKTFGCRICLLGLAVISLGAWDDDYENRTEFVTRGVGDAVEVNKATQTIDPWPPYVKNRNLTMDGKRAGLAMQRYQANKVITPHPLNPTKAPELPIADTSNQPLPPTQPQQ